MGRIEGPTCVVKWSEKFTNSVSIINRTPTDNIKFSAYF